MGRGGDWGCNTTQNAIASQQSELKNIGASDLMQTFGGTFVVFNARGMRTECGAVPKRCRDTTKAKNSHNWKIRYRTAT